MCKSIGIDNSWYANDPVYRAANKYSITTPADITHKGCIIIRRLWNKSCIRCETLSDDCCKHSSQCKSACDEWHWEAPKSLTYMRVRRGDDRDVRARKFVRSGLFGSGDVMQFGRSNSQLILSGGRYKIFFLLHNEVSNVTSVRPKSTMDIPESTLFAYCWRPPIDHIVKIRKR